MAILSRKNLKSLGISGQGGKRKSLSRKVIERSVSLQPFVETRPWVGKFSFSLNDIAPLPKERHRFSQGVAYTSKRTSEYEKVLVQSARRALGDFAPLKGPLGAKIVFRFPIPQSWPKDMKVKAESGLVRPTRRMDLDNGSKAVLDALNGILYRDDSSVVELFCSKIYSSTPGVDVSVWEFSDLTGGYLSKA